MVNSVPSPMVVLGVYSHKAGLFVPSILSHVVRTLVGTSCTLSTILPAPVSTKHFRTSPSGSVNQTTHCSPGKLTIGWDEVDTGLPSPHAAPHLLWYSAWGPVSFYVALFFIIITFCFFNGWFLLSWFLSSIGGYLAVTVY